MDDTRKNDIIADYYSKHYDDLVGYAFSRTASMAVAEDAVQDAFLRILATDKMVTPVTVGGLVHTTLRNLTYDYWRRRNVATAYEQYLAASGAGVNALDTARVCGRGEMVELLERAMSRLTYKRREAYGMWLYDGMCISDISINLNIMYKTAENRLCAARKLVRRYMEKMLA